jgi:hypothetical protein
MGPGIGIVFPEWPPAQLAGLKESFARRADRFSDSPEPNGGQRWNLRLGRDADAPEVVVTLGPNSTWQPDDEVALGWPPRGYAELHGFKHPDLALVVRTMASLACEAAERLGGVVCLDGGGGYATAQEYTRLSEQPGFEVSGYPAAEPAAARRRRA